MGPNGIGSVRAAAAFLANSGMYDHHVIYDSVIISVELIPIEARLTGVEGINGIYYRLLYPKWVIRMPYHAGISSHAAIGSVPGFRMRQRQPVNHFPTQVVHAARVLKVVVAHRISGNVETRLPIWTSKIGAYTIGDPLF